MPVRGSVGGTDSYTQAIRQRLPGTFAPSQGASMMPHATTSATVPPAGFVPAGHGDLGQPIAHNRESGEQLAYASGGRGWQSSRTGSTYGESITAPRPPAGFAPAGRTDFGSPMAYNANTGEIVTFSPDRGWISLQGGRELTATAPSPPPGFYATGQSNDLGYAIAYNRDRGEILEFQPGRGWIPTGRRR